MLELAEAKGEADALLAELGSLSAYLDENREFDTFLSNPTVDVDAREKSLERIFRGKVSDLLVDSLQVLNRHGRLELIRAVTQTYRLAHQRLRGRVEARVRTAVQLTRKLRARISEWVGVHTGMEAELVETVDESLIGGMVIEIGDRKFDASVAARLRGIGESLLQRASREIYGGRSHVAEAAG